MDCSSFYEVLGKIVRVPVEQFTRDHSAHLSVPAGKKVAQVNDVRSLS